MTARTLQAVVGAPPANTDDCEHQAVSIQEVFRRHHDSLIQFLRQRLRVPEDAYDVAQEAYIRMMKYEGSSEIRSASSMLFRVAVNVARDLGRATRARRADDHVQVDDVQLVSEQPSPERVVAAERSFERVYDAIERLPPKCRQVFLLSRVRGMSYPEIAGHCGISVKMVEKHISHALAVCAQKVGGIEPDSS